jgi:hypothetical protein
MCGDGTLYLSLNRTWICEGSKIFLMGIISGQKVSFLNSDAQKRLSFLSDLDIVVLAPLLNNPHNVLNLWIRSVSHHSKYVLKIVLRGLARYHQLEYTHTGPSLSLPVFRFWVESLQHIERLSSVHKVTHLGTNERREE